MDKKRFLVAALLGQFPLLACAQSADVVPLCTDRPTKANATCTVPAGDWQVESDIASSTHDSHDGITSDTFYAVNPYLKYGLNDHQDIEINWAPNIRVRSTEDGHGHTLSGAGDLYVRFKSRLVGDDDFSMALIPFVKAPTAARGVGNDRWEGGLALPIGMALPAGFSLTLGPEVDWLADSDGHGHHATYTQLVNLSHALGSRVTLAVEYWAQDNHDPAGTIRQRSADVALSFLVNPTLQLDVGANFGLNSQTPDSQLYLGIAHRF